MCAMIAMTVNTMKLVTNREWNSCASASVSPDRDDLSVSTGILTSVCVTVHALHGDFVGTLRHDRRSGRQRRSDDCNIDLAISAYDVAMDAWDWASANQVRAGASSSCFRPATTRCAPSARTNRGNSA